MTTPEPRPAADQQDWFAEDLFPLVTPPAREHPLVDQPIPFAPTGLEPPPARAARPQPCRSAMPYVGRNSW